jgi:SagB-type dehydrogenase family enzyme
MLPIDDAATLPLLYHINSEPWLNVEAYKDPSNEMRFKQMPEGGESVLLPRVEIDSPLRRFIRERRSRREFVEGPMPMHQLADILENAYGLSGLIQDPNGQLSYTRPVPSGGALYPLEVYTATQNVEGLADGVYHFNVLDHSLEALKYAPVLKEIGGHLLGQHFLETANVAVLFGAVFERTLRKYGPRGYRYILLEAGHAAQNICLMAAELGLGSICIGGFYDGRLNRYLGLDGKTEAIVYAVGLGLVEPTVNPDVR